MKLIITPKNKKEQKIVEAFLKSLSINFCLESEEDNAFYSAMKKGCKTKLLTKKEQSGFIRELRHKTVP